MIHAIKAKAHNTYVILETHVFGVHGMTNT